MPPVQSVLVIAFSTNNVLHTFIRFELHKTLSVQFIVNYTELMSHNVVNGADMQTDRMETVVVDVHNGNCLRLVVTFLNLLP